MKMHRLCAMILLAAACLCAFAAAAASADTVSLRFYLQDQMRAVQRDVPAGKNLVEAAVRGLVEGPTVDEKVLGYTSAIPDGVTVQDLVLAEASVTVSLSAGVLAGLDEGALELIFKQFTATLGDFPKITQIKLMHDGKLLSEYLPPAPTIGEPAPPLVKGITTSGLSGRNITIGPSHGRFWNGSGWYWQRSDPCGFGEAVLEDTNSIRLMQFLYQYLTQDGATVHVPRELNESNCCNPYEGLPYWKMAAYSWLRTNGLPCSVWCSYTGNCGAETAVGRSSDDIRARPLFADYRGSNIYIAHHTNAGGGGTANGTETFRDTAMEHPEHETNSYNLAVAVQNSIISAIREMYDGSWSNRGVKDSAGGFGEIRIPNRPAILIELAFHDNCTRDAQYLMDNFFRSVSEWAVYRGVCQYFGTSPTWDRYSDEFVSDTIPTTMTAGQSYNVSVTFRNRGVVWSEARSFRLGAVGDSDPFTGTTRRTISGEVRPGNTYTFSFTLTAPATPGVYTTDWRMVRDGVAWFGATCSRNVTVNPAVVDTEPPTVPTNLQASAPNMTQVNLAWTASTDNVGVAGYKIYRNGSYLTSVTGTSYSNTGLSNNTPYSYTVSAYDGSGNESAQCAPVSATTWALIYQDGIGSLSGWTADVVADGTTRGLTYDGGTNHGSYTGAGSATATVGSGTTNGCLSYRAFAAPFTSGRYEGYFYDSAANNSSRQGMFMRGYNGSTLAFSIYMGTYSAAPGSFGTYSAGVFNGSAWVWNGQIEPRSIGWHKYQIDVLPSGSGAIKFYIDDALKASQDRFANLDTYGISRNNIGHNYSVNIQGWFDDLRFSVPVPNAPVIGTPSAQSASSIRWNFTDASDCESAFSLQDSGQVEKGTAGRNASYIDESGFAANTQYTRHVHAKNGTIEGQPSGNASRYTLSVAPTTSTVTCDRAASTAYADPDFEFTAVGGFGAGKVQYYRYAWDQSPMHTWSGSESQWNSGTLPQTASSAGSWYLHVRGYNGDNVANGALDLGPYIYAAPTGTIAQAKALADGQQVALAAKTVTANFGSTIYIEEADGSSGIRVEASGPAVGSAADVAGVIQTNTDGERYVASATAVSAGTGVMPFVPMMNTKHLGGGALNAYTVGVTGGIGVNNIGLLVSVAGKITHGETGFAYLDDGSGVLDGSGWLGVRVDKTGLTTTFTEGKQCVVTGVSSILKIGSDYIPVLKPRSDADVTVYP